MKFAFSAVTVLLFICLLFGMIGGDDAGTEVSNVVKQEQTAIPVVTPSQTEVPVSHLYDNAEIRDVHNGYGTEVIGKFSLVNADSSECTVEALSDWYYNHVKDGGYNWSMILYTDKNDLSGVYSVPGLVRTGVRFAEDSFDQYRMESEAGSIIYFPQNGTLQKFEGE